MARYTGPAYPFGPDVGGTLGPKGDLAVIFTSIVNIITTIKGSIPHNPGLGSIVPLLLFDLLDEITLQLIRLRLGRDPEPFSPVYHVAKLAPRPVLIISGENDRLMPIDEVRALHDAADEPKELWVIPGAEHGGCQEVAGAEYDRRIREFFAKNL